MKLSPVLYRREPVTHEMWQAEARKRRKARIKEEVLTTLLVLAFLGLVWLAMFGVAGEAVWRGR